MPPATESLWRRAAGLCAVGTPSSSYAASAELGPAWHRRRRQCGLTLVRTTPYEGSDAIEGAEHGEVEYALTKPEWEARTAGDAGD
jgi:hypothetical protein